jgi:hypothetical protein
MDFLNAFLSGPIPSVVSVLIALMLAAGYWFFVFPLVSEAASLRESNNKLTAELSQTSAAALAVSQQLLEIKRLCQDQSSSIGQEILPKLLEHQESVQRVLRDLRTALSDFQDKSTRTDSEVVRDLERIVRIISEINDKQSQVSGVILGLSMSNAHNPARGI